MYFFQYCGHFAMKVDWHFISLFGKWKQSRETVPDCGQSVCLHDFGYRKKKSLNRKILGLLHIYMCTYKFLSIYIL